MILQGGGPWDPPVLVSPTGRALWDGTELLEAASPFPPCPPGHEGVTGPHQLCCADLRYADEAVQDL